MFITSGGLQNDLRERVDIQEKGVRRRKDRKRGSRPISERRSSESEKMEEERAKNKEEGKIEISR